MIKKLILLATLCSIFSNSAFALSEDECSKITDSYLGLTRKLLIISYKKLRHDFVLENLSWIEDLEQKAEKFRDIINDSQSLIINDPNSLLSEALKIVKPLNEQPYLSLFDNVEQETINDLLKITSSNPLYTPNENLFGTLKKMPRSMTKEDLSALKPEAEKVTAIFTKLEQQLEILSDALKITLKNECK